MHRVRQRVGYLMTAYTFRQLWIWKLLIHRITLGEVEKGRHPLANIGSTFSGRQCTYGGCGRAQGLETTELSALIHVATVPYFLIR